MPGLHVTTRLLGTMALMLTLATAGCSDSRPASPAPGAGLGETISGRERFGWVQPAADAAELATYRYAVYVDGNRGVLNQQTCAGTRTANGFECSAPLPAMTAGPHTLELAAFVLAGDAVVEGPRSAPLRVTVAAVTAPVDVARGGSFLSSDGLRLDAAILAQDLDEPVDLAVSGDGRVFVAERAGRVRVFGRGGDRTTAGTDANVLELFGDVAEAELLSVALAPEFSRSGLLHLAFAVADRNGPVLHLARAREAGGRLAEAAVLSTHEVSEGTTALIRFGPDRHLYAGVGAGANPDAAQQLSAVAGKILRVREDGATPDDNPWRSPVWSAGHREPRGFVWHPQGHSMWEVERDDQGGRVNAIRAGTNYGWPLITGSQQHPGVMRPVLVLPPGIEASGVAMLDRPSSPLFGDLIVSAREGEDLLRLRPGADGGLHVTGRLLQGRFGRIGQVATGADGSIYLVTANGDLRGAGRDMLIRIDVAQAQPRPDLRGVR